MKLILKDWLLACLFWIILFLACSGCSAQKVYKSQFRPAPLIGEKVAVAGLLVKAVAFSGLVSKNNNVNKIIGTFGYTAILAGITIDINKNTKTKRIRFKK